MAAKKRKKRKISKALRCLVATAAIVLVAIVGIGWWLYDAAYTTFQGDASVKVIIPKGATTEAINDSLRSRLGSYGVTVARLWGLRGGNPSEAAGLYIVTPGDKAWSVASRIKDGRSSTVKVTFNNIRLMSDLANRVSASFPWTEADFMAACDSILPPAGFNKAEYPAAFIPDTYEFYGSAEPAEVVAKLLDYRNAFWNEERREKAAKLGLTPKKVATIASIVEEESSNREEQPAIARLYINRLEKDMKLQADPTVKYALGDFSLRRIYSDHLAVESPYNTYHVKGLPPGPIRIPERRTLELVLDAPKHDYLYMCAKPGGEQRHNFAVDFATHVNNAKAYRQWLDSANIN